MRAGFNSFFVFTALCSVVLGGCSSTPNPDYQNQRVFSSANEAVESLGGAVKAGDAAAIEAIFGTEAREVLASGDPVADRRNREVISIAMQQQWSLERIDSSTKELIIGDERWPFPIPLVKDSRGWWFDTLAGKDEVHSRRIGRNELAAIGVCRAYVVAQQEYAATGHDGNPAGIYAQKVRSTAGKQDGLYWETTSADEEPSPLGALAAQASAEGYSTAGNTQLTPFHGYFYRILTRQGADASGGEKDYVVNGNMSGGFALIAYPAEYGNSGIMTFIVGPDGVVYERDLGEQTLEVAGKIIGYSPDSGWRVSE